MMCDGCGAALVDAELHRAFHERLDAHAADETFTCTQCFAEVKESARAAHRWWHVGMAELLRALQRSEGRRADPQSKA
jgi:hypothetical protein